MSKELQGQVANLLFDFTADAEEAIESSLKEAAELAVETLRETSPKRTGGYAKSWKVKKAEKSGHRTTITVYNSKYGHLTHLLEHGHALVSHEKKHLGRSRSFPHIKPAEEIAAEKAMMEFILKVEKGL